jgi:hypothetical protein
MKSAIELAPEKELSTVSAFLGLLWVESGRYRGRIAKSNDARLASASTVIPSQNTTGSSALRTVPPRDPITPVRRKTASSAKPATPNSINQTWSVIPLFHPSDECPQWVETCHSVIRSDAAT